MPDRIWLYGNEQAGEEVRGNQIFRWHLGVETDAYGDYEGKYPGQHWHHEGDTPDGQPIWIKHEL